MPPADRYTEQAEALSRVARLFGERQWCLATSGNFSARVAPDRCLVTRSGKDKTRLSAGDFVLCDLDGNAVDAGTVPSAETPLHACLYRLDEGTAAVLHTHSAVATVMSRASGSDLTFAGFEMQKAFPGVATHDAALRLPVYENTQDMTEFARRLELDAASRGFDVPGFLVRGHGLYAWGRSIDEAQRHVEGLEFLLSCALGERSLLR